MKHVHIMKDIPNVPGIYKITNTINGKSYIGQSIYLKKRIRRHLSYKCYKDNLALYKAFDKYGIDKFTIEILETIDTEKCDDIKYELDKLEIFYIKKYNSYISGYNQTLGGDAGIAGYKFTNEQRNKVSKHSKLCAHNFYKPVYLKSIISGNIKMYISESYAAKDLNCSHSQISKVCNRKQYIVNNEWVGGRTMEEVNNSYIQFLQKGNKNGGKFTRKLTTIDYYHKLKSINNGEMPSRQQIIEALNLSIKTIATYNKELLQNGLLEKVNYNKYKLL